MLKYAFQSILRQSVQLKIRIVVLFMLGGLVKIIIFRIRLKDTEFISRFPRGTKAWGLYFFRCSAKPDICRREFLILISHRKCITTRLDRPRLWCECGCEFVWGPIRIRAPWLDGVFERDSSENCLHFRDRGKWVPDYHLGNGGGPIKINLMHMFWNVGWSIRNGRCSSLGNHNCIYDFRCKQLHHIPEIIIVNDGA